MRSRVVHLVLSALAATFVTFGSARALAAQEVEPGHEITKKLGPVDIIMPHITDSKHIEYPCLHSMQEWACEATLPTWHVTIGEHTYDFGPTKHVVFLFLAALVTAVVLIGTARAHVRASKAVGHPKGFAAGIEGVILYLRNEIFLPAIGHGGERLVLFPLTLFFFILFCNLFGLMPYGATPTGNLSVTATLAIITFLVVEITGMRTLGKGYISTIIYWPHDVPIGIRAGLTLIMSPMELMGKFIKPFALTIRLFANMIGGHVVILAFIGLIFMFGFKIAIFPWFMALCIMGLEILVALIQAFIFALLSSVFIGQLRVAHH
jgi:F-type H+-transporting ATPase subunit a